MKSYHVFVVRKCLKYDAFEQKKKPFKNHTILSFRILGCEKFGYGQIEIVQVMGVSNFEYYTRRVWILKFKL